MTESDTGGRLRSARLLIVGLVAVIVILGVIVGFIVISMFLPLVQIIGSLQSGGMEGEGGD